MRTWLGKLRLITAVAIVAVLLPITAGPAHAAETSFNQRRQWLTAAPTSSMPLSQVSREITLAAGTYGWWNFPFNDSCETYTGHILAGTYSWTDQLWPGSPGAGVYRHDSYLTETSGGWGYHIRCYFGLSSDGEYTWGSGLDPHF
ncbi:hypothetical protein O7627_15480 [Solwaraspora sp. WMMD1047]|uniref:hypothetical protein n=1 Tax=Solwaraspora sp. WMMD1047 TaxID=3016102 RepID=UPI002416F434|nr:hypothetical protein [Solwaraspora sp. WMMD1047]MDG4830695.1 hypothetical protein [Solwaraspora sp. WMMD1047]